MANIKSVAVGVVVVVVVVVGPKSPRINPEQDLTSEILGG